MVVVRHDNIARIARTDFFSADNQWDIPLFR